MCRLPGKAGLIICRVESQAFSCLIITDEALFVTNILIYFLHC